MAINPPVMEMKLLLGVVTRSMWAIENAQSELEVQHRDLTRQAEWIKDEIRKAMTEAPPPTTDLDLLWERMKPHWQGDMGPAFMFVKDVESLFKP